MKITVDIDCTPEEARAFLGLPDVRPLQDAMLAEVQERLGAGLAAADPETLMKTWMPAGVQGFEQLQKMFWSQFAAGQTADPKAGGGSTENETGADTKTD